MQYRDQWHQLTETVRLEAGQRVAQARQLLKRLHLDPADLEAIHELLGTVHTLKGSAGLLGVNRAIGFAHEFEDILIRLQNGDLKVSAVMLEVCGQCLSRLLEMIQGRASLTGGAPDSVGSPPDSYYEVPAPRLQRLCDEIVRLARAISQVRDRAALRQNGELEAVAVEVERHVQAIGDEVDQLGYAQLDDIFRFFEDTVRDLGLTLGKPVELHVDGNGIQVSWHYVGRLQEVLNHLVLNALDHGIETPAERLKAGKPATANLYLRAFQKAGLTCLEVCDDGRGVDTAALVHRADELGLALPMEQRSVNLVFEPGLSTAPVANTWSGRGQGMAMVHRIITGIGGALDIQSHPGRGCRIGIQLPMSICQVVNPF